MKSQKFTKIILLLVTLIGIGNLIKSQQVEAEDAVYHAYTGEVLSEVFSNSISSVKSSDTSVVDVDKFYDRVARYKVYKTGEAIVSINVKGFSEPKIIHFYAHDNNNLISVKFKGTVSEGAYDNFDKYVYEVKNKSSVSFEELKIEWKQGKSTRKVSVYDIPGKGRSILIIDKTFTKKGFNPKKVKFTLNKETRGSAFGDNNSLTNGGYIKKEYMPVTYNINVKKSSKAVKGNIVYTIENKASRTISPMLNAYLYDNKGRLIGAATDYVELDPNGKDNIKLIFYDRKKVGKYRTEYWVNDVK